MVAFAWAPVLLFCTCHYLTGAHEEYHWLHDIYRRLYYIPILYAALQRGLWGGIAIALTVSLSYAPHAFHHYFENDPGSDLEKLLEIVLYNIIAIVSGILADRQEAERLQVERALISERETRLELQRAHRLAALGQLVAGIAHEIKNPLHTINGATSILDKIVPQDKPETEMWGIIKDELQRLGKIADRFLSFAKPQIPNLQNIDVSAIIIRFEELVSSEAQRHDIGLVVEKTGAQSIAADADQIIQVLVDIAVNGFSAMEQSEHRKMLLFVRVETHEGKDFVAISLQNSGPIIPSENLERVFDPFFTTRANGSGLGLSTAARIIEQHGGFIRARNVGEEGGVVFSVLLPQVRH
jgi:signal transduction histidine kinase